MIEYALHFFCKYFVCILHSVESGDVIGGALVNFYALDSIVTSDSQLISVGFEWTPSLIEDIESKSINVSNILPYFERKAVFQVFESKTNQNKSTCIGCEVDELGGWYGAECEDECDCKNGYCNDGIDGEGNCYCTIMSYGEKCEACDGFRGSCDPLIGLCDSGPTGTGECKFCYALDLDIADNLTNSSFDFGFGEHYGPQCSDNCSCNTDNGICFTSGNLNDSRAGHCIYCTDSNFFGLDCDEECDCDSKTEYCSNGVTGSGCVKYDYGGLLKDKSWEFYALIASALFVILFSITWWQTNKNYKAMNNGKSIPWCPQREKQEEEDEDVFEEDEYKPNDLKEHMIKHQNNIQNGIDDPNEPPAVSRVVYSNGNDANAANDYDDERQRYNM